MAKKVSQKARYDAWITDVVRALNTNPTPIRALTLKDFPRVDFEAMHRTGQKPEAAAYIAIAINQYGKSSLSADQSMTRSQSKKLS